MNLMNHRSRNSDVVFLFILVLSDFKLQTSTFTKIVKGDEKTLKIYPFSWNSTRETNFFWHLQMGKLLQAFKILYTGCLNMLCPTSNQKIFRINWHSKQNPLIFGILSRGDLCMENQFLGCLPYTASTASYLKDAIFLMIQRRKTC